MTWTSDEKLMSPPVSTGQKESDATVRTKNGGYLRNDNSFPSEYYVSGTFPFLFFYASDRDGIKSAEWRLLVAIGDELNPVICGNRVKINRFATHKNCTHVRNRFYNLDLD